MNRSSVLVSTIHKAKGREFDRVILLLEKNLNRQDNDRRALYVGITRAKTHLSIHAVPGAFPFNLGKEMTGVVLKDNPVTYPALDRLTFNLDHRDVNLGLFKNPTLKRKISSLRAGSSLFVMDHGRALRAQTSDGQSFKALVLSKKSQEEIDSWRQKGYEIESANIYRIVAWRDKNDPVDPTEYAVILPTLFLRKVSD